MTPQRRHIHGLFVDLQTRTQKLSQNSELFRNTGKGETKRPEIEKWVTNRPSSNETVLEQDHCAVFSRRIF